MFLLYTNTFSSLEFVSNWFSQLDQSVIVSSRRQISYKWLERFSLFVKSKVKIVVRVQSGRQERRRMQVDG